jgi:hypothetical protein
MPAWLAPIALGALAAGGTILTNRANAKQADKQMRFQADQNSTAAQRAVEDYRKAGLNPALAYDRPAASGSGASAVLDDPAASGISTARDAARLRQEMQLARANSAADIELKKSQALAVRQQGQQAVEQQNLIAWQSRQAQQQFNFDSILFPTTARQRAADALLTEYMLPGARANARLDEKAGIWRPLVKDLLSGARSLSPFMSK